MRRLILCLVLATLCVPRAGRAANDYPYPNANCNSANPRWGGFYYRNCTDWVAWRLYNNDDILDFDNHMDGGHWGDAGNWSANAATVHYVVNHTPVVGCIAQWSAAAQPPVGHVAWVEAVNSDGTVNVAEYNFSPACGYGTRTHVTATWYIHPYHSDYVSNSNVGWVRPGQVLDLQAQYRNDAREYWINSTDTSDRHSVELWSCDSKGDIVDSWLVPVGWIAGSRQRVTTFDGAANTRVNRTGLATFSFQAQVPVSATSGNVRVWFRPVHGGLKMDEWGANGGGLNYYVQVDADPPAPFTASVTPTTNAANAFSFSWTPSSDGLSGLKGYYWSVNGGPETFTTATSVPSGSYATIQGQNILNVRAEDNAGVSTSATPVAFTLTSSPCPGREIPHSPCVGPLTCYPALTGGWDVLPDRDAAQWRMLGESVGRRIAPGATYSIGLEYRVRTASRLTIGLGESRPTDGPSVVLTAANLPASAEGEWRTYWSAPVTVAAADLQRCSQLRIAQDPDEAEKLEIRAVRIVAYR